LKLLKAFYLLLLAKFCLSLGQALYSLPVSFTYHIYDNISSCM
jgi:hypothetical protein